MLKPGLNEPSQLLAKRFPVAEVSLKAMFLFAFFASAEQDDLLLKRNDRCVQFSSKYPS